MQATHRFQARATSRNGHEQSRMHRIIILYELTCGQRCRRVLVGIRMSSRRQGAGMGDMWKARLGRRHGYYVQTLGDNAAGSAGRPACTTGKRAGQARFVASIITRSYAFVHVSALFEAPVVHVVIQRSSWSGRRHPHSQGHGHGRARRARRAQMTLRSAVDWRRQALQNACFVGSASWPGMCDSKTTVAGGEQPARLES